MASRATVAAARSTVRVVASHHPHRLITAAVMPHNRTAALSTLASYHVSHPLSSSATAAASKNVIQARYLSSKDDATSTKATTNDSPQQPKSADGAAPQDGEDAEEPVRTNETDTEKKKEDEEQQQEPEPTREEQLEAEIKQLKDKLLRTLADQENTRRIAQNDVAQAKKYAIKSFAQNLLEVSDNLELALKAIPDGIEKDKEDQPVLVNLLEGVRLTEEGLLKAFRDNGLVRFGQAGERFDPNKHDALYEYADPNQEPGVVGQVMKSGFLLNNRVLRPAEVGVVKKEE